MSTRLSTTGAGSSSPFRQPPLPLTPPTSGACQPGEHLLFLPATPRPQQLCLPASSRRLPTQQQSAQQQPKQGTARRQPAVPRCQPVPPVVSLSDTPREVPAPRPFFGSFFNRDIVLRKTEGTPLIVCLRIFYSFPKFAVSKYLVGLADKSRSKIFRLGSLLKMIGDAGRSFI